MKIQSVSTIEKALAELAAKRESVVARAEVIAGERKVLGFISLVGHDAEATAKLEKLNVEWSAVAGALSGLDDAIAEGEKRLQLARAAEASRADQASARELAEQLEQFIACGDEIDRALEVLVSGPQKMARILGDIGSVSPDRIIGDFLHCREIVFSPLSENPRGRASFQFYQSDNAAAFVIWWNCGLADRAIASPNAWAQQRKQRDDVVSRSR